MTSKKIMMLVLSTVFVFFLLAQAAPLSGNPNPAVVDTTSMYPKDRFETLSRSKHTLSENCLKTNKTWLPHCTNLDTLKEPVVKHYEPATLNHLDASGWDYDDGFYPWINKDLLAMNFKCFPNTRPEVTHKGHKDKVPGPQDSHESEAKWAIKHFCQQTGFSNQDIKAPFNIRNMLHRPDYWDLHDMHPKGQNTDVDQFFFTHHDLILSDDVYLVSVQSISKEESPTCDVNGGAPDGANDLWEPLHRRLCEDFLWPTWRYCKNGGRGGSIDVACMRYTLETQF